MSNSDSEVERIMTGRPPSSYGSMCSDDPEDDEIQDAAPQPIIKVNLPTKINLHRPDSPETGITSVTQARGASVRNEGVYITAQRAGVGLPVPSYRTEQDSEVMEVEDDESYVQTREADNRERRRVQAEASDPEPTASLPAPAPAPAPAANSENELSLPFIFKGMLDTLRPLNALELQCFVRTLSSQRKNQLDFRQLEQEGELDVLGVVDRMLEKWEKCEALHITIRALYDINKRDIAGRLESVCRRALVLFDVRANHKRRYHSVYEGICRPGKQRHIRQVYVESPIALESPAAEGPPEIRTSDLFSPRQGEGHIRIVVTTGIPAIGLSVTSQMFVVDWTEERVCQDFQFVFVLPGHDLHLVRNTDLTFLEFLASFYPEAKHAEFLACPDCRMLFVIDALELCKHPLDFQKNPSVTEVTAPAHADVLLTSLIKGDLLPHACIWITTNRPTARKIPPSCVSRVTELKGFGDAQKDEYFTKRTKNPALGRRVLDVVKGSPRLYDACYLPLFSWIVSFIYEWRLQDETFPEPMPALANFYMQYVIVLTNRKIERHVGTGLDASRWQEADKDFLMKMGELALKMLRDGRSVFYGDSVSRLALDAVDVAHRGGISCETGEPPGERGPSFRFVHHSVQQFMAALYVYAKFRLTGENALEAHAVRTRADRPVSDLYKPAVNLVLGRRDGAMDLFLHFLFGLATLKTEKHLRGHLLPQYHPEPRGVEDALKYARKKIKDSDRCRGLEAGLNELEQGRSVR